MAVRKKRLILIGYGVNTTHTLALYGTSSVTFIEAGTAELLAQLVRKLLLAFESLQMKKLANELSAKMLAHKSNTIINTVVYVLKNVSQKRFFKNGGVSYSR